MGNTGTELPHWTGVVLAGGRSTRMGRDKAGLVWHGKTLLAHACATLAAAGATRVVVSGDYPDWDGIPDAMSSMGPLGGLASVFAALPDGVLLLVPVDMPLLTQELLKTLAGQDHVACATYRDSVLPMRVRLDSHSRGALAKLVSAPTERRSLRALHDALGGEFLELPPGQEAALANFNTREEWQAVST